LHYCLAYIYPDCNANNIPNWLAYSDANFGSFACPNSVANSCHM
jgi:hypothetical protein